MSMFREVENRDLPCHLFGYILDFEEHNAFYDTDDIYIPVKAAVEGEVGHLGIDSVVGTVVHSDDEQVLFIQRVGNVHTPGGVAAVMVGQALAVEISIGGRVGTADLQIVPVGPGEFGFA